MDGPAEDTVRRSAYDPEGEAVLSERLEAARARVREVAWSDQASYRPALAEELAAERALAAHRGEPYAEVIDI
jgi:hypothetical protein